MTCRARKLISEEDVPRSGSTRLVYRIDTLPGSFLSTKALVDQVSGPAVRTVGVPCADGSIF